MKNSIRNSSIVKFNFQGDELDVIKDGETLWVSVRRVSEALGLAANGQIEKLKSKAWARDKMILSHDASGRNQEIFTIDLDSLPMWLATIESSRVAEDVRPKLEAYQKEAAKVLRDYFFDGYAVDETRYKVREIEGRILIQRHKAVVECVDLLSRGSLFKPEYLQRKADHSLAIISGEEVSKDTPILIDVGSYLTSKGLTPKETRRAQSIFGRIVKGLYVEKHGVEPGKCHRLVNGSDREVNSYTERDYPLFDEAWGVLLKKNTKLAQQYARRVVAEL